MAPFKRILFPVVFSEQCEAMARYVVRITEIFGATATLLHVADPRNLNVFEEDGSFVRPIADLRCFVTPMFPISWMFEGAIPSLRL